jgi:hypothetical protein
MSMLAITATAMALLVSLWAAGARAEAINGTEGMAKYSPQFGGFCAYEAARGHEASIIPAAFTVIDGKLYLNFSIGVRAIWQEDQPNNIRKMKEEASYALRILAAGVRRLAPQRGR